MSPRKYLAMRITAAALALVGVWDLLRAGGVL